MHLGAFVLKANKWQGQELKEEGVLLAEARPHLLIELRTRLPLEPQTKLIEFVR